MHPVNRLLTGYCPQALPNSNRLLSKQVDPDVAPSAHPLSARHPSHPFPLLLVAYTASLDVLGVGCCEDGVLEGAVFLRLTQLVVVHHGGEAAVNPRFVTG